MNIHQRDVYTVTFTIADNSAGVADFISKVQKAMAFCREMVGYEVRGPFTVKLDPKEEAKGGKI